MNKLKLWNEHPSWESAEAAWEAKAAISQKEHPIKGLKNLPSMPGMTKDTASFLKWKSLKYLVSHDEPKIFKRFFFKHPLKYSLRLLKSAFNKKSYIRKDDLFLYGVKTEEEFSTLLNEPNTLLIAGFSYCHKPFECPSKRFSPDCIHDPNNPVCSQCFIGKAVNALPEEGVIPLFIPTIHYIGEKIFEITEQNPSKKILFLITACEMTLEMFGDWGNMVKARGIGIRLDGRICNTMKAFELSEKGIKPGLTIVQDSTQAQVLSFIKTRRQKK